MLEKLGGTVAKGRTRTGDAAADNGCKAIDAAVQGILQQDIVDDRPAPNRNSEGKTVLPKALENQQIIHDLAAIIRKVEDPAVLFQTSDPGQQEIQVIDNEACIPAAGKGRLGVNLGACPVVDDIAGNGEPCRGGQRRLPPAAPLFSARAGPAWPVHCSAFSPRDTGRDSR